MNTVTSRKLLRFVLAGGALTLIGAAALGAVRIPTAVAMSSVIAKQTLATPPMAMQLRITGAVQLDVTIDEAGSVEVSEVLHGNPILAKAAQDSVKKWKFKPYKQGDKAVKVVATLTFDFK
jgi:TonB family protein